MNTTTQILLAVMAFVIGGCAIVLSILLRKDDKVARRVQALRTGQVVQDEEPSGMILTRMVTQIGAAFTRSGLLPAATIRDLETTLETAGLSGRKGLSLFIGCKFLLFVGLPPMAWLVLDMRGYTGMPHVIGTMFAAVVGLLGPDWIIRYTRSRHLQAVERGLPDALDMMVICAEAGLPLEPAINRVSKEIRLAHPSVARELAQTASEMRIVTDHRIVLTNLGLRTGLPGCKRLGTTLVQTLQYGTPLVDALRVLAGEMRTELLTRFEARAARLPVLLTLPMIVFILPCVFLVIGGPAIIQVMRIFEG